MTLNIIFFLSSILLFSIDVYLICSVWFRGKRNIYLKLFFAMGMMHSFWALFNGINILLSEELYQQIYPLVMVIACMISPVMLFYILHFTKSGLVKSRPFAWLFIILPAIDILVLLTNPLHHEFIAGYNGIHPQGGKWFIAHAAISYIPLIISVTVFFRYIIKNISRTPSLGLVGVGMALPIISNVLYTFEILDLGFDITPFAFLIMFIIFTVYSIRFRLFDVKNTAITNLFSSLSDSFLIIDNTGYVADANPSFKSTFPMFTLESDKTAVEDVECFFKSVTLKQNPEDVYNLFSSSTEEIHSAEITVLIDGEFRYFTLSKNIIWERGQYAGFIINLTDVSNYQKIQQMIVEINEKNNRLLELKNVAESASKAKSGFLARMSHEIRTPMNAIVGMSELILRENTQPVIHEHALSIKNAGANLLSIINDILDFSKIESGKLEVISAEYLFTSLINDVLSIIRMRITEKQILFVANIDCNIPNKLIGDEIRIRQVLLNLLSNAVKYTNEGFISITIDGKIEGEGTVLLIIEITDSGIGIKEEDIEKLFGDFVQVDTIKNKGIEGTGLGLAIVRNICRLMGGDISVYSEYGNGSTFTITIPQKFNVYEKFADVENPDEKQVLIYEPRAIYANSIVCTIDNLGVRCTLADSQSRFYEELKLYPYPFIFVSAFLFESTKRIVDSLGLPSKIVLMSEFGEVVTNSNVRTIAMPVHSISVANILNDISENISFNESKEIYTRFTAPAARILIVDDIATNLKVAEGLMSPYKMMIDTCMSGAETIEMVKENMYDIIFMDHMMPEMDGIEATNIIRGLEDDNGYFKNVPIVALTANAVSGVKEMFLKNGMNDFLAKPIDTSKLNSLLEKWIPHEKCKKYDNDKEEQTPVMGEIKFEIEGVNVNTGISMTGGTIEHYMKTLTVFCKDGEEKIKEIRECMKKNNIQLFTIFVHAIKSSSATIGANRISRFANELETAGKNGDIDFIKKNTEEFLRQFEILLQNIISVIMENPENCTENKSEAIKPEFLGSELQKLRSALEDVNIGEINAVLNKLETETWDKKISDSIYNISKSIILFEYDESIALIDELLSV